MTQTSITDFDTKYDIIHGDGDKLWKIKHLTEFLERNDRYKEALQKIKDMVVPAQMPGGPVDMSEETKRFCAAFGACIGTASEALYVDGPTQGE